MDKPEDYVLSAVVVNEAEWAYVDNQIKQIKIKHFPSISDEQVELHAKDMENNSGIFNGMKHEDILDVFKDLFTLIGGQEFPITLFSVVIQKNKVRKRTLDPELWGHRMLFERINKFVVKKNEQYLAQRTPAQYGILIEDTEGPKKDSKLRAKVRDMLYNGTKYADLDFLIEDPLFTDSKWRNLSQIVDCVAYCVRRKYKTSQSPIKEKTWGTYFAEIYSKFDKPKDSDDPMGCGIKIFP